ncbi:hypothetical protein IF2G_07179 [Cordyceps javanica]|nr:hypothetical protein IF2G_07179 [Cordyceps javanica]
MRTEVLTNQRFRATSEKLVIGFSLASSTSRISPPPLMMYVRQWTVAPTPVAHAVLARRIRRSSTPLTYHPGAKNNIVNLDLTWSTIIEDLSVISDYEPTSDVGRWPCLFHPNTNLTPAHCHRNYSAQSVKRSGEKAPNTAFCPELLTHHSSCDIFTYISPPPWRLGSMIHLCTMFRYYSSQHCKSSVTARSRLQAACFCFSSFEVYSTTVQVSVTRLNI